MEENISLFQSSSISKSKNNENILIKDLIKNDYLEQLDKYYKTIKFIDSKDKIVYAFLIIGIVNRIIIKQKE